MKRYVLSFFLLGLVGCTAIESDLGSFANDSDACDPRGTPQRGGNLTIQFLNTTAHINQDMRLAIEVGDHNVEGLAVISTFDDPNLELVLPEMMTNEPSTLAFWADTNANGTFDSLSPPDSGVIVMADSGIDAGVPLTVSPDHQWFRPICPNGDMTFTHTTPFQDISHANSDGAVFQFLIPTDFQTSITPPHHLLEHFAMAVWAVQVDDTGRQTRVYYRWQPYVAIGGSTPTQRTAPSPQHDRFQIGGNVLMEHRGTIDQGSNYEVHFVIDVDGDGQMDGHDTDDYNCTWMRQQAPMLDPWVFDPTMAGGGLVNCDDNGFHPELQ